MCRRLDVIERKLAFLEGRESLEAAFAKKNEKIEDLKDIIVGLREDLKMCKKIDGEVFLQPRHMCNPYVGQPHALSAHAPVVDVHRVHGSFDDPIGNGCPGSVG